MKGQERFLSLGQLRTGRSTPARSFSRNSTFQPLTDWFTIICVSHMRFIALFFLTCTLACGASLRFSPVAGSKMDRSIPALSDKGPAEIMVRHVLLDAEFPDGRKPKCQLVIRFDPETGHFNWVIHPASSPESISNEVRGHRYLLQDAMIMFAAAGNRIYVHTSTLTATGLDDAQARAIAAASTRTRPYSNLNQLGMFTDVPLWKELGRDFFAPSRSAAPGRFVIEKVLHTSDGWELTLIGQWKERVRLNSVYAIIEHNPVH
jgi:hypothetical protein